MMLYTKYESSGLCSFGQEDFWKLHFEKLFLTPWPTYATNWNGLNNFDRGPPRDHSCEVWSKSNNRFQRRCSLKKLLTDGRTDDGRRTPDIEGSQKLTEHFVLRWAKKVIIHLTVQRRVQYDFSSCVLVQIYSRIVQSNV